MSDLRRLYEEKLAELELIRRQLEAEEAANIPVLPDREDNLAPAAPVAPAAPIVSLVPAAPVARRTKELKVVTPLMANRSKPFLQAASLVIRRNKYYTEIDDVLILNIKGTDLKTILSTFAEDTTIPNTNYVLSWTTPTDFGFMSKVFTKNDTDTLLYTIEDWINKFRNNPGYVSYTFPAVVSLTKYKIISKTVFHFIPVDILIDQGLDFSFTGNTNCFIECIKESLPTTTYDSLKDAFPNGITQEQILEISKKHKLNLEIYDILGNPWLTRSAGKYKTYKLIHHNQHIQKNNISLKLTNQEFISRNDFKYLPYKLDWFVGNGTIDNPKFIISGNTVYKIADNIFVSQADEDANKDKIPTSTTTLISRVFRNIVEKYSLSFPTGSLAEFLDCADHTSIIYKNADVPFDSNTYLYDQTRAYDSYDKSKYFTTYGFPRLPNHFYAVDENIPVDYLLSMSGFCRVDNVVLKNSFLRSIQFIQNNGVYSNLRLRYLLDNKLASFDITATAFNVEKDFIDFHVTEVDGFPVPNKKVLGNAVLGRLIPSGNNSTKFISTTSAKECKHFMSILNTKLRKIETRDYNDKKHFILTYEESYVPEELKDEREASPTKKYSHVHSYIIDYQIIRMLPFVLDNQSNLAGIYIDGIYLTKESIREPTVEEHIKPPVEKNIVCSGQRSYEHKLYTAELPEFPHFYGKLFDKKITLISGLGGTGKTTELTDLSRKSRLHNSVICFPNNSLLADFKDRTDLPCYTYHKLFGFASEYSTMYKHYSNIILDEASMISKEDFDKILSKLSPSQSLYVIQGVKQLPPVEGEPIDWDTIDHVHIKLEKIHRTADKQYIARQRKAIDLTMKDKVQVFSDRIISDEELLKVYRLGTEDIVICSTNEEKTRINDLLTAEALKKKVPKIPIMYVRTTSTTAKNQRVLIDRFQFDPSIMVKAFASTVHAVQGKTCDHNVILSKSNLWTPELFNVAMSRTKRLDQFYILGEPYVVDTSEEDIIEEDDATELDLDALDSYLDAYTD